MNSLLNPSRRGVLDLGVSLAIAPTIVSGSTLSKGKMMPEGRHAFAFQTGDWRVRHRKLRGRLVGSKEWVEFDGTCRAWEVMDGQGNLDDHLIGDPAGAYRAATFRMANRTRANGRSGGSTRASPRLNRRFGAVSRTVSAPFTPTISSQADRSRCGSCGPVLRPRRRAGSRPFLETADKAGRSTGP